MELFWKSTRIFAELEEFNSFLGNIGLDPTMHDFSGICDEKGLITIQKLCSVIDLWKNDESN